MVWGTILEPFWHHFGIIWGPLWDDLGTILGQKNILEITENFPPKTKKTSHDHHYLHNIRNLFLNFKQKGDSDKTKLKPKLPAPSRSHLS